MHPNLVLTLSDARQIYTLQRQTILLVSGRVLSMSLINPHWLAMRPTLVFTV